MARTNQTILSFAVLKAIADTTNKDYLENFVPFVAECIRTSGESIVSTTIVQSRLRELFGGLRIPQSAIDKILERLKQREFIVNEQGAYIRNTNKLNELTFESERARFIQKHDALVAGMIRFVQSRFRRTWSISEAEISLQSFLNDGELLPFLVDTSDSPTTNLYTEDHGERFIVASYVKYLSLCDLPSFEYLETVSKGCMLAQAIFLPDENPRMQEFKDTEIYFDTSFLMWAIDCAGQVRRDPCIELLAMLYETKAKLRCFSHTIGEIRVALESTAYNMRHNRDLEAFGPGAETLRYFRSKDMSPADVFVKISQIEVELNKLHIIVVDTPNYGDEEIHRWVIDENLLQKSLQLEFPNLRQDSLERDVKSIAAVVVLREGNTAFDIEKCKSMFITSNSRLVRAANQFFRNEINTTQHAIPPCLNERALTTYLWLNMPLQAPDDLPRKRIIADCYAATQPSESLWRNFIKEVDKLETQGDISPELCYVLRNSPSGTNALMESTLGDEKAFTRGTIDEILLQVKEEMSQDAKRELEIEKEFAANELKQRLQTEHERDEALKEVQLKDQALHEQKLARQQNSQRERERIANIRDRITTEAQMRAKLIIKVIKTLLFAVSILASIGELKIITTKSIPAIIVTLLIIVVIITVVIQGIPQIMGRTIADYLLEYENQLATAIQNDKIIKYGLENSEINEEPID